MSEAVLGINGLGRIGKLTVWQCALEGKFRRLVVNTGRPVGRGVNDLVQYLEQKLGIRVGETTPDGKFSLVRVECLGSCGTAPMFQVNDDYHEDLTREKIDEILDNLP